MGKWFAMVAVGAVRGWRLKVRIHAAGGGVP